MSHNEIVGVMTTSIEKILDDFAFLDDWEDKYRYVIELGKALPEFDEDARNPKNKVNGCVSQVWLKTTITNNDSLKLHFDGDSDAHIVRGLVAIMIAALSDKPASEVISYDAEALMSKLGLDSHITPQRSNGLRSMVERMKSDALKAINND